MNMIKINRFVALITMLLTLGCAQKRFDDEAKILTATMDLDRKVGQMIMVAVPGNRMNSAVEAILKKHMPGGIILFGYNLTSFINNKKFISDMQAYSCAHSGIPLFVSLDQEGGRVIRIGSGVTQFPGNMAAGISGDCGLIFKWGRVLGLELRNTGINMNLAPVLDVNNNPFNPVINTRSFGSDPRVVAELGSCYIKGLQKSRCLAVGKHFPGHGDTNVDSHTALPVIRSSMKRLKLIELSPFREAIASDVECIMTAHISYPDILLNGDPATISPFFLTKLLRSEMGFKGLVITDDIEMAAISKRMDIGEAAVKSIQAGADIVLISSYDMNIPQISAAVKKAVAENRITPNRIEESVRRILAAKMRYGVLSFQDGKARMVPFALSGKERNLLNDAGRLNEELSRRGIFYYGTIKLLYPDKKTKRLFITRDVRLCRVLAENRNNILYSINDLARYLPEKRANVIVYLHLDQPDLAYLNYVSAICKRKEIALVLISSGNPYPITESGIVQAGLLSFSDTDESIHQLGICLNGGFMPALDRNLFQGIKK
jgi:beta-glucosidase-like glycosyl hydrolase